jgi:hypothetical protein
MRVFNANINIRLMRGILNKSVVNTLQTSGHISRALFLNTQTYCSDIALKQSHVEQFWGFRQKRYKKLRPHSFPQITKYEIQRAHLPNNTGSKQIVNKYGLYTAFKNNKYKSELISVTLARRLLRTKRTLILPVHINITLITNSYDVVHS